ncbi:transglutaminase domain-containing protein [Candidatus Parcubacteria bacterium]|nr:transglutaminase domain-containing protein [Candidatus Parcubacteria bacterium]
MAEAFRYKVDWEPNTQTMTISSRQSYRLTETLRISNIEKLWMPIPREWDGAGMSNVKLIEISPKPDDLYEDANGNKIAFWETKKGGPGEYKIVFEADFSPIWYNIDPSKVGNYDVKSPEYQKYTKPSPWIESDNEKIIKLAHEIVGNEKNPLIQVKLLHNWVAKNIKVGESGQTALQTLEKGSGDCGGHSFLFVALCRALGIPARPVSGLQPDYYQGRFVNRIDQKEGLGFHVWSEFYLPNFGWVQCDTATGEGHNIVGIDEPRIILSRGDEITLGHGIPSNNFAWFHIPRAIPNPHPQFQTNGEELSLNVEMK